MQLSASGKCPANDEAFSNALQRNRGTRVEEGKKCFFVSVSSWKQVTCPAKLVRRPRAREKAEVSIYMNLKQGPESLRRAA
jgi:hypothetical protein